MSSGLITRAAVFITRAATFIPFSAREIQGGYRHPIGAALALLFALQWHHVGLASAWRARDHN
jgi:hypothetical protein